MSAEWRLIDSGEVAPAESAAIDEAILDAHSRGEVRSTLHYYIRSRPTISLGYSQKVSETIDLDECRRLGVAIIRRVSGGGTIYTDPGQLIYALVVRGSDLPSSREASFAKICGAIAETLSSFGVDARVKPINDVEVSGKKLSGSAQMRRRRSVLQHGTILVDTDLAAMDALLRSRNAEVSDSRPSERVVNLSSLLPSGPEMAALKTRLTTSLESAFGVRFAHEGLTASERSCIDTLVADRYSQDAWNLKY